MTRTSASSRCSPACRSRSSGARSSWSSSGAARRPRAESLVARLVEDAAWLARGAVAVERPRLAVRLVGELPRLVAGIEVAEVEPRQGVPGLERDFLPEELL